MGCDNNITDKCKLVKRDGTEYYLIDRMDEVREEMLNLLRIVDDICNKENLKYWIDGGSMIGAIRHGGFIPWPQRAGPAWTPASARGWAGQSGRRRAVRRRDT